MQSHLRISATIARLALAALVLHLAACSVMAPAPSDTPVEDRAYDDARQAYDRGAYREAARLWQQQAVDAEAASAASKFRLYAADAWWLAGDTEAARDLLGWVEENELAPPDRALLNLVIAEIDLERRRPVEARNRLDRVGSVLPEAYAGRYDTAVGRAQAAMGSLSSINVQRAGELADQITVYDPESALALLRQLEQIPSRQLAYLSRIEGDAQRAAWFDLALVLRNNLVDGSGLEADVRDWERRHAGAPVNVEDALDLWLRYRQEFGPPAQIAVLLPESGGLRAAAHAIRDGILSAYLAQPADSEIRFYDSGDQPDSVLSAYFEAADDGADWIVGPLDRQSVEALLNLAGLATPVLALNDLPEGDRLPEGLAQQVFGMSLSQEREAAAIARRMAMMGHRKAILLAPEDTWGERITSAFQAEFLHEGREILVAGRYLPSENDHSAVLEQALRIEESKERKERLENRLGVELEFEAVRRSDVDAIFLAAGPEQARQLAPQLRFFDAGDIPTYATSRVYAGRPDPAGNQDLDGVAVPLTAWQLNHRTRSSIPRLESLRGGQFGPLYAIGMDAWNILPWLDLMRKDPDFRFPGESGTYSIAGGNLQREPVWGKFRGGVPVAVSTDPGALRN